MPSVPGWEQRGSGGRHARRRSDGRPVYRAAPRRAPTALRRRWQRAADTHAR